MIYLKWVVLFLLDLVMLPTVFIAAPIIALFTREGSYLDGEYTWGGIYGTYDNPPQGDEGYVRERSLFPPVTTGVKGYINRVWWMIRNNLYGYAKIVGVEYDPTYKIKLVGDPDISDKYKVPGWYFVRVYDKNEKVVSFEFYGVFPWSDNRDLRMRLGWKILTNKFDSIGFAPLVGTINPFDGYGSD